MGFIATVLAVLVAMWLFFVLCADSSAGAIF